MASQRLFLWLLVVSAFVTNELPISKVHATSMPKIAIIIDDVGNRFTHKQLHDLPKEVAFSILPDADFSIHHATLSQNQGRDVMIHMPMESLVPSSSLGQRPLLVSMQQDELEAAILDALEQVPGAVGINNHMGSKFTQLKSTMDGFFRGLQNTNLFFVDSRTTPFTRAMLQAHAFNIPAVERNVFLDHYNETAAIEKQFERLLVMAKQQGRALAIGHPNPLTLDFLNAHLPRLEEEGIMLVSISDYVTISH